MEMKIIVDEALLAEAMGLFVSNKLNLPQDTKVRILIGPDGIIATVLLED